MRFSPIGVGLMVLSFCVGMWLFSGNAHGALVASYGFEAGSGTTALDSTGTNTGTLVNATWNTTGRYGNALTFNGTSARVSIPDASSLDIGSTGTIEAWVSLTALNRWHALITKGIDNGGDSGHSYSLEIGDTNRPYCSVGNGSAANAVQGTTALSLNTWTHVACVWSGTALTVYVNGVSAGSVTQTVTPYNSTAPVELGRWGQATDYLQGQLDEVRLYNTALSAAEITTDMNTPVVSGGTAPPKILGLGVQWSMPATGLPLPITFAWNYPLLADQATPLTGGMFELYRDVGTEINILVAAVAYVDDQTTFTAQETAASPGQHCWKVRAVLGADASSYSNEVCADVQ